MFMWFFMRTEYLVIIVVGVFLAAFFAVQLLMPKGEYVVDGIRIISGSKPDAAIGRIAGQADLVMRLDKPDPDSSNPCVIAMGTEITKELAALNKTPAIYAANANSTECLSFGNKTGACPTGAQNGLVSVEVGECDCMRIGSNSIFVEGSKQFMCNASNIKKISAIIGFAVGSPA